MKYIHSQELLDIPEGGTFYSPHLRSTDIAPAAAGQHLEVLVEVGGLDSLGEGIFVGQLELGS